MKKLVLISLMAGCAMAITAQAVLAEDASTTNTVPMSQVLNNLKDQGYIGIRKVEMEKGVIKADGITTQGKEVKLEVNPQTGEVIHPKTKPEGLSMLEVAKKVEAEGYRNISQIKLTGHEFKVQALDQSGKKSDIKVNAISGTLEK